MTWICVRIFCSNPEMWISWYAIKRRTLVCSPYSEPALMRLASMMFPLLEDFRSGCSWNVSFTNRRIVPGKRTCIYKHRFSDTRVLIALRYVCLCSEGPVTHICIILRDPDHRVDVAKICETSEVVCFDVMCASQHCTHELAA